MVTQELITLSVPQVLDLALNSPEIGAVNFNLLHSLLHIMVQQLQMTNTTVEFRGKDGEKIKLLLDAAKGLSTSSVQLTEYKITSDAKGKKTRTEVKVDDSSKASSKVNKSAAKEETLVLVQPDQTSTPQLTVCLSEQTIINMQDDIADLKMHLSELQDLPKNFNLLEAMKHKDKPVVEMFQLMSLAKRIDAAEGGLQKLASLVEDLTGEMQYAQLGPDVYYDEGYDEFGQPTGEAAAISSPAQTSPTASPPVKASAPRPTTPKGGKGGAQKAVPQKSGKGGSAKVKKPEGADQGKPTESATDEPATTDDDVQHQEQPAVVGGQKGQAQASPTKVAQQKVSPIAVEEGKRSPRPSVAASVATEGVRSPMKRPPPELVIKIGNSEKRLQAIEDTLKAYGIPPPVVPQIKYPSRIDLPPIDINATFLHGHGGKSQQTSPQQSPIGKAGSPPSPPSRSPQESTPGSPTKVALAPVGSPQTHSGGGRKDKDSKREEEALARLPTSDAVVALQKDINKLKRDVKRMKSSIAGGARKDTDDSGTPGRHEKKKNKKAHEYTELETKVRDSAETLVSIDQNFNNQVLALQNQFSVLEMEVNGIMEKLTAALPGGDSGVETIGDLFKKVQGMQIDIENIAETTASLVDDMATRKSNFENLNETVELLKTIKADKEDLEDALADKADKCAINRKVSHDQFDTACDELSRGIEEALEKLTTQELLWQQALDEIQFEISNKLDKMELGPLRDFINNKLRMLQERMKSLTALKKEQEAAGTKSKFLRNVNCISCDKDVIMRKQMDAALMPQPRALPPNRSMAPYLAYELDALRKQQKTLANSRNLNHFESAITGGKSPRMDDHVCNRYCGGSHTVTTPQQRVTRMGHFLAQWGPGAVPVTDTVPVKEEPPKQEPRKPSLTEQGASGDQKKAPPAPKSAAPEQHATEKRGSKVSKGSNRSGSAPNLSESASKITEGTKGHPPAAATGPAGDEKTSTTSQEKVRTPSGSIKGSQGSVKRTSKGSAAGSLKTSKQGTPQGSKEGSVAEQQPKDVPEEIPEETPSEVAAAEGSHSKEASDIVTNAQHEEETDETAAETTHEADAVEEMKPEE